MGDIADMILEGVLCEGCGECLGGIPRRCVACQPQSNRALVHPEKRCEKPPTPAMLALLKEIVATNGGGLCVDYRSKKVVRGLVERHLIQGKRGNPSVAVHTTEGLKLVREAQK